MRRALLAALVVLAAPATARASELIEIPIPARGGEVADMWLPGYPGPPRAKVLLPDGYDARKAYPLLMLLVGLNSKYTDWSDPGEGEIAKTAKGLNAIIVMPEGGDGWYADWWNKGRRGAPSWESYHLDQVLPQIRKRFRIRPERRYHALAGVSMGGLGTAYLGGRLPGYYGSVAVISGLVDVQLVPVEAWVMSAIPLAKTGSPLDPNAVIGSPGGFYANGHNPVRLAANMEHTRVYMASGNGMPAPDSSTGPNVLTDLPSEMMIIKPASDNYAAALTRAGIDLTYQPHAGYHDWPNFRRELRDAIRWGLFAPVEEHPTSWVNDTVATHGRLWEFAYRFDAPPDRVVRFRRRGDTLHVGTAPSAVTITTRGCVIHVATPADITVPKRRCSKRVRPARRPAPRSSR
jgi:S-formylglutathione hydrolase FrmB